MRYMLLIYTDEQALDEQTRNACYEESTQFAHQLKEAGKFIATSPLQPTTTASTVRHRDGKPQVTDGPFAETKEQLGGFFLVEARDRDEAIEIASRIPAGRFGTVEVRPAVELDNLPEG